MHRFFLPPTQAESGSLTLTGSEAHHGAHVLRIRSGERVVVLDGAGHEMLCEVLELGRRPDVIRLKLLQKTLTSPLPYRLSLAQGVTKAKTMDLIVQKSTELGLHQLVPILAERSVSQIEEAAAGNKMDKWRGTMIEAVKQCGSPWLPQIADPQPVQEFIRGAQRHELNLLASLQPDASHPQKAFARFQAEHGRLPRSVCVWVGPEGDFTPAEISQIRQAGAQPITLGPLVLRSETAAIYCISIVSYELQATAVPEL